MRVCALNTACTAFHAVSGRFKLSQHANEQSEQNCSSETFLIIVTHFILKMMFSLNCNFILRLLVHGMTFHLVRFYCSLQLI